MKAILKRLFLSYDTHTHTHFIFPAKWEGKSFSMRSQAEVALGSLKKSVLVKSTGLY